MPIDQIWMDSGIQGEPILCVEKKGKSLVFTNESANPYTRKFSLKLNQDQFDEFYTQLLEMAESIWGDLKIKDVTGFGNDYGEYYDRELDNDGGASIDEKGIYFYPPAPHLKSNRIYRFTKSKIETYLYDLRKQTSFGQNH